MELSEVDKQPNYVQRKSRKEKALALQAEVDQLRAECGDKIKILSQKYSTKENLIRNNVYNASSFKPERKVNSWNAEIAYKAKQLRESR